MQDEVLRPLGSHGILVRRLTGTAQLALPVDDEGRSILSRSPQVVSISDDVPRSPTGGG